MKITDIKYHHNFSLVILLLVISVVSACTTPKAQDTNTPTIPEITNTPAGEMAVTSAWHTYQNKEYNFQFRYPPQGQVTEGLEGRSGRLDLTFTPGTNLREKFVQVDVLENPTECRTPLSEGYAPGSLQRGQEKINGIDFKTAAGGEGAAGNIYDWKAYMTTRDGVCISISFVLHATNPDNYTTPLPVYEEAKETAVFQEIISTFDFTD